MVKVTQIMPGFGKLAMEEAGTECQRFEAGVHAAAFSSVAPVAALCEGAGSLRVEAGRVRPRPRSTPARTVRAARH
jgi:hypothetical protein